MLWSIWGFRWWEADGASFGDTILEPDINGTAVTLEGKTGTDVLWTKPIPSSATIAAEDGVTVTMELDYTREHVSDPFVVGCAAGGRACYLEVDASTLLQTKEVEEVVVKTEELDYADEDTKGVHGDGTLGLDLPRVWGAGG